jgi:hypothetical protein
MDGGGWRWTARQDEDRAGRRGSQGGPGASEGVAGPAVALMRLFAPQARSQRTRAPERMKKTGLGRKNAVDFAAVSLVRGAALGSGAGPSAGPCPPHTRDAAPCLPRAQEHLEADAANAGGAQAMWVPRGAR